MKHQPNRDVSGESIDALETPAVIIDLDIVDQNIARMASIATDRGVDLRPHVKTHKSLDLVRKQLAAGAVGITAARVSEAEAFVDAGCQDVLIAYPIIGALKRERLAALAHRATVRTCVDALPTAHALSRTATTAGITLDVLLDVNTGLDRTGCDRVTAAALGAAINRLPGLKLVGVFTYGGFRPRQSDPDVRRAWGLREGEQAVGVANELRARGVQVDIVSVGGTICGPIAAEVCGVTEIRPGGYLLGDANYVRLGALDLADCALRVMTTVVSRPTAGRAVVDAGSNALGSDTAFGADANEYGIVPQYRTSCVSGLWPEHAVVSLRDEGLGLGVGDLLELIPNHAGSVMNLTETCYVKRAGHVTGMINIGTRGLSH